MASVPVVMNIDVVIGNVSALKYPEYWSNLPMTFPPYRLLKSDIIHYIEKLIFIYILVDRYWQALGSNGINAK